MYRKPAIVLWMVAVVLYLISLGLAISNRSLDLGDSVGLVVLAVVGWAVFRRQKS